jgi:branched-chain amino acid transport system substrate-binding protein
MRKGVVKGCIVFCFVLVMLMTVSSVWAERPIVILVCEPFSGPVKFLADRFLAGTQMAADEVNAQGGLLGRKIVVIHEDTQGKPDIAVQKAQKYLLEGSVDIVTAGLGSPQSKALKELTKEYKNVLFVDYGQADEAMGKDFAYHTVRLYINSSMVARTFVSYMAMHTTFKKIYLINQDYSYGRDCAAAFKREIVRQMPNAQIVGEDFHPMFVKDFSPFLTKIAASNADVILTANWGTDISILLKQRKELGVKAIIVNNNLADPNVIKEAPDAALGAIVSDTWMQTETSPESVAFLKRWREKYKGTAYPDPDPVSVRTYNGSRIVFEAIKKAQSLETAKLMPAFEGLHMKGLNGDEWIRPCDHQLEKPMPIAVVKSVNYPYYGVPTIIPAARIEIEESATGNARCMGK